ncbi:hypothetical protein BS47DRAFT_263871, partial [Hydnum rufescens UP504]
MAWREKVTVCMMIFGLCGIILSTSSRLAICYALDKIQYGVRLNLVDILPQPT